MRSGERESNRERWERLSETERVRDRDIREQDMERWERERRERSGENGSGGGRTQ